MQEDQDREFMEDLFTNGDTNAKNMNPHPAVKS